MKDNKPRTMGRIAFEKEVVDRQVSFVENVGGLLLHKVYTENGKGLLFYSVVHNGIHIGLGDDYHKAFNNLAAIDDLGAEINKVIDRRIGSSAFVNVGYAFAAGRGDEVIAYNAALEEKRVRRESDRSQAAIAKQRASKEAHDRDMINAKAGLKAGERIAADIFLDLLKQYGIKINLRTHGWIKKSLIDVHKGGYDCYGAGSTKVMGLVHELINAINKENATVDHQAAIKELED
jgi:hypothetical protein